MSSLQGVGYASVVGRVRNYQVYSEAINGRIQARNIGGERLEWTVTFPPMTWAEFDPLWTYIDGRNGMINTFSMKLPDPKRPNVYQSYTVRLMGDVQEYEMGNDGLIQFEIDVVQVK